MNSKKINAIVALAALVVCTGVKGAVAQPGVASQDDLVSATICNTSSLDSTLCHMILRQHFATIRNEKPSGGNQPASGWRMPDYTYLDPHERVPVPFYGSRKDCELVAGGPCYPNHKE